MHVNLLVHVGSYRILLLQQYAITEIELFSSYELECLTHTLFVDTKGTRALGLSYLVADVELVRGNIPLARYESHRAEE